MIKTRLSDLNWDERRGAVVMRLVRWKMARAKDVYDARHPMTWLERAASRDAFYRSDAWRELRFETLKRHGYRCMACQRPRHPSIILHVDHIKPRSLYPKLALDPENLQVLCEDCNLGKGNRSADDLRPQP